MPTTTTYEIVLRGRPSARLLRPLLDEFTQTMRGLRREPGYSGKQTCQIVALACALVLVELCRRLGPNWMTQLGQHLRTW